MEEQGREPDTIEQPDAPDAKNWIPRTALFLTGQTISLFGSSLVQFAIIWYITLTTKSGMEMTIATVCGFAPQVVISLFSGVWADRFHRKKLIIMADSMVAAATLVLALLFLSGHRELWIIYIVLMVRSVGQGIQTPAVNAVLPQLVPQEKIIRVGGINGSLQSVMFLLAPAASGAILSFTTIEATFFIDVGTAAVGITIMSFLKVPLHAKARLKLKGGYLDDLKEGIRYVGQSKFLISFFIFFALFMFFVVPAGNLTPLMVARTFGDEVWRLSLMEVLFSVGSVVGGVIVAAWGGFQNRTRTIAMGFLGFGIFTILLGIVPGFAAFLTVMVLAGLSMPFVATPAMAMLQEQVDNNMQGRIFSLVQVVQTAIMPLGMVVFGPLADYVRVETLLVITGIILAIISIAVTRNKYFHTGVIADGTDAA